VLFQNLYRLKHIGKYGSSDPHLPEDWIKVEQKPTVGMDGQFEEQKCQFPSSGFINIFYNKLGKTDDPQKTIVKADFEWKSTNAWTFTKPSLSLKQRFQISINV
jgi:hypothetical protein